MAAEATGTLKLEVQAAPAETELQRIVKASEACATSLGKMAEAQNKVKDESKKTETAWQSLKGSMKTLSDGMAKFGQVVTGVQQAWALMNKVMAAGQFAVDVAKLRGRFDELGGSMDRFKDVADEGMTKVEIMRASLQGMTGDVRLTAQGMELVLEAADKWGDKIGKDGKQVTEEFTRAIQTGQIRALKALGIQIEEGANKQETLNNLLQKYKEIAADSGPEDQQLKRFERANTALKDLGDTIREKVGQGIVEVIDRTNNMADAMTAAAERTERLFSTARAMYSEALAGGFVLGADNQVLSPKERRARMMGVLNAGGRRIGFTDPSRVLFRLKFQQSVWKPLQALEEKANAAPLVEGKYAPKRSRGGGGEREADGEWGGGWGDLFSGLGALPGALGEAYSSEGFLERRMRLYNEGQAAAGAKGLEGLLGAAGRIGGALDSALGGAGGALSLFGGGARDKTEATTEKLQEMLGDRASAVGSAYDALSSGIMAAVDAAITGSDSIGKAFAKAASAALKSIAVESTGRAIYHGALALGSLAFGDVKGAGLHAAAAAKFGLAAVGTGVLAAGLGSLGAGGGASAGAGGGGASVGGGFGGQSGGGGPRNITINVNGYQGGTFKGIREFANDVVVGLERADRAGTNKRSNVVAFE